MPDPSIAEVTAFGGIPDPNFGGHRSSVRVRAQPDADELQMERAMRAAKLHDIETSIDMNFNQKKGSFFFRVRYCEQSIELRCIFGM
jgi:hypothetical protein